MDEILCEYCAFADIWRGHPGYTAEEPVPPDDDSYRCCITGRSILSDPDDCPDFAWEEIFASIERNKECQS